MADKDNESAPGVVCCNLDSATVTKLFRLARFTNATIQAEATTILSRAIGHEYWLHWDDDGSGI